MAISFSLLFVVVLEAVAVYFAYLAIVGSRTPQGAVAWVVFLIAAPYFAIVSYLFLGHRKFNDYVVARRASQRVLDGMAQSRKSYPPRGDTLDVGYQVFETLAASPVVSGNDIQVLIDGDKTFDAIFDALENARSYILFQFYIIRDDTLGQDIQRRLVDAAQRGVAVYVLYDSIGSSRLPWGYINVLTEAGVKMLDTNALQGPTNRLRVNFRNHRKTVIVDGRIGFTGGLNVGDEYMGRSPVFGHWRDTHCKVEGPIVSQLQLVFCEDWLWATEDGLFDDLFWRPEPAPSNFDALIMATGPADDLDTGNLYFCAMIRAARHRLWIASPYFVPDADIVSALKVAALKGIDVRILIPEKADHWVTWLASFDYLDELREAGVVFWRYDNGFMHQKVALVDDSIAAIGTHNLDNRSCALNFEASVLAFEEDVAKDVADMFKADFAQSRISTRTLSEQPLWIRLGAPVSRLFAPLL
nr:cardiolipin synthase [uncultured Shimia sp.]